MKNKQNRGKLIQLMERVQAQNKENELTDEEIMDIVLEPQAEVRDEMARKTKTHQR